MLFSGTLVLFSVLRGVVTKLIMGCHQQVKGFTRESFLGNGVSDLPASKLSDSRSNLEKAVSRVLCSL